MLGLWNAANYCYLAHDVSANTSMAWVLFDNFVFRDRRNRDPSCPVLQREGAFYQVLIPGDQS